MYRRHLRFLSSIPIKVSLVFYLVNAGTKSIFNIQVPFSLLINFSVFIIDYTPCVPIFSYCSAICCQPLEQQDLNPFFVKCSVRPDESTMVVTLHKIILHCSLNLLQWYLTNCQLHALPNNHFQFRVGNRLLLLKLYGILLYMVYKIDPRGHIVEKLFCLKLDSLSQIQCLMVPSGLLVELESIYVHS